MFESLQLKKINSESAEERRKAAKILRTWKDQQALSALQKLMSDKDMTVQGDAVLGLMERGILDDRVVDQLRAALIWMACQREIEPQNLSYCFVALKVILTQPDAELRNAVLGTVQLGWDRDLLLAMLLRVQEVHALKALEVFCTDKKVMAKLYGRCNAIYELYHHDDREHSHTARLGSEGDRKESSLGEDISNAGVLLWLYGGIPAHQATTLSYLQEYPEPVHRRSGMGGWATRSGLMKHWLSFRLPNGYFMPEGKGLTTTEQRAEFFLAAHKCHYALESGR